MCAGSLGRSECWISEEFRDRVHAMFPHISAIGAGAAGLLQTAAAISVRRLAIDMDISHADRDQAMAFLAQNQSLGCLPKSCQITGILKQVKETMEGDSALATAAEQKAIGIYDELVSAKAKQTNADTDAIESKRERVGNLGVGIATMKADLVETARSLIEDKSSWQTLTRPARQSKQSGRSSATSATRICLRWPTP